MGHTIPNTQTPLSKPIANSSPSLSHKIRLPSPEPHRPIPSPISLSISLSKLRTPAFLPVTRFHSRIQRSARPTLTISFMLGCIAKSFTPEGRVDGVLVSPVGRFRCLGVGALIIDSVLQFFVEVIAMRLFPHDERSLVRFGKCNAVMAASCVWRVPRLRLLGFWRVFEFNEGRTGPEGGRVERW
jgi:hypothetical protein